MGDNRALAWYENNWAMCECTLKHSCVADLKCDSTSIGNEVVFISLNSKEEKQQPSIG